MRQGAGRRAQGENAGRVARGEGRRTRGEKEECPLCLRVGFFNTVLQGH